MRTLALAFALLTFGCGSAQDFSEYVSECENPKKTTCKVILYQAEGAKDVCAIQCAWTCSAFAGRGHAMSTVVDCTQWHGKTVTRKH